MGHKKETKIVVAIENPSILKAFKAQLKDKSSDIKFNVLISYPFIGGVASDFVSGCRDMIKTLYLDSGAYSVQTGKAQVSLSEYSKYINMFPSIKKSVINAMKLVNENNFLSVAFPLIGAGSGNRSEIFSLITMMETFQSIKSNAEVIIVRFR